MALKNVQNPDSIRKAAEEFDDLGRDAFLAKYGFKPSRDYFLILGGRSYDSKAIVGAAHGIEFPDQGPLRAEQFSGGEATVARKLAELGFDIRKGADVERSAKDATEATAIVHVVLKWSFEFEPRTIELHREVVRSRGSVWWGKRGDPRRSSMSKQMLLHIRKQLDTEKTTYVYLYRPKEAWRAQLVEITDVREEIDEALVPQYYGDTDFNLWFRLSDFEQVDPEWLDENLQPVRPSGIDNMASYLRSRATLLYVQERTVGMQRNGIREGLERILREYAAARGQPFSHAHPIWDAFRSLGTELENSPEVKQRRDIVVRPSAGLGNWAKVPWIALLDRRVTDTTQEGVYCVFLFRQDSSGVYLTLNQGVVNLKRSQGTREARRILRERASQIRTQLSQLGETGFALDDEIDLRADPGLGAQYEDSTIAYKLYESGSVPDDTKILFDLETLLSAYDEYTRELSDIGVLPPPPPPEGTLDAVAQEFSGALREAHLSFGNNHDDLVRAFVSSLATKRFVILTGLSGPGKTQIALRFGEWLGEGFSHMEPVRPDWTGAESLFGFEDALEPSVDGRRAWSVPRVLRFMLLAARDVQRPYLLILDEMNLAHVERYFADVLSGIESDYPVLPNLRLEEDARWRLVPDADERIPFPPNLSVAGTVNVDETTYMFSPKVLDRANVFEFRVTTEDLSPSYRRPVASLPGTESLVRTFLHISMDSQWHLLRPAPELDSFQAAMKTVHRLMSRWNFEFGHRVFYEAIRFSAMLAAAGVPSWKAALDRQMMQKILPRLHGSRRRLEAPITALGRYCFDLQAETSADAVTFDPLAPREGGPQLPLSFEKVQRMVTNLRANQFASFAE